jgi:hypothetical protein
MSLPSTSRSSHDRYALDASAIINLLATGKAADILSLLGPVVAERRAFAEVRRHPLPDGDHAADLSQLIAKGLLEIRDLEEEGRTIFFALTADDIAGGLDDGEAATIALSVVGTSRFIPILDDRKAIGLLQRRWPACDLQQTIDLLSDDRVTSSVPHSELAEAVFLALIHARMRVPRARRQWVVDLIGRDRAAMCASIGQLP